jgi:thiamine biosynthesis lipoprotein
VEIEDPRDASRRIATLRVRDGAVATSAANRRRWRVARSIRHHIVDPRTQQSATTDLLQVTVVAPTAELADVLAKTVFVLGAERGRAFLARTAAAGAILVPAVGAPIACGAVDVVSP